MEETVRVPFMSGGERDCNKKANKHQNPGPGTYIDINNPHYSSVAKPLLKFSSDRTFAEAHGIKLGAFGSNTKRFEKNEFSGKDGPAPGQYDFTIERTIQAEIKNAEKSKIGNNTTKDEIERPNTQSVFFKSTTDRFMKIDG